jgi:hypothetical protein
MCAAYSSLSRLLNCRCGCSAASYWYSVVACSMYPVREDQQMVDCYEDSMPELWTNGPTRLAAGRPLQYSTPLENRA